VHRLLLLAVVSGVLSGCASAREAEVRDALASTPAPTTSTTPGGDADASSSDVASSNAASPSRDDTHSRLGSYVATALRQHPSLQAKFAAWQQAVHAVSSTRQLPAPQLSFGVFAMSVETRVGPQLGRVGVRQAFPWPTKLFAGADAATARAQAAQHGFEAEVLAVAERVTVAYWTLWEVRRARRIHQEHLVVMRGIADAVRARLVTGMASLADVQQIDLGIARLEDMVVGMDEKEAMAEAQLRAAVGLPLHAGVPTDEAEPALTLPPEDGEALLAEHPTVRAWAAQAEAADAKGEMATAKLFPSFSVGADWIITGPSPMPGVADSDKDAVMLGGGVSIPVWNWLLDDDAKAAAADARQKRAMQSGVRLQLEAQLEQTRARLRDSHRRGRLYKDVLIPQAEATTQAVLGAFSTGKATVAQALLAQKDVLELRILHDEAVAQHARAWAQLDRVLGGEHEPAAPTASPEPKAKP